MLAVLVGLFILRQIDDDDDPGVSPAPGTGGAETTDPTGTDGTGTGTNGTNGGNTTVPGTPQPANVFEGATVVVANANTTGGSAGDMSDLLAEAGFTMGDPLDAAGEERQLDVSKVYFAEGNRRARQVAETAARLLGGVRVQKMPAEIPVQGGEIDGEVLVMLGIDAAGKSLDELSAG